MAHLRVGWEVPGVQWERADFKRAVFSWWCRSSAPLRVGFGSCQIKVCYLFRNVSCGSTRSHSQRSNEALVVEHLRSIANFAMPELPHRIRFPIILT